MVDIEPTPLRSNRKRKPALESGVAPTEMVTNVTGAEEPEPTPEPTPEPMASAPAEAAALPTSVDLTGPQVAEIRARNDAIDEALREAASLEASAQSIARDAERLRLLAGYGQEALSQGINNLITSANLDPRHQYQVDLKRGRIVPGQRPG